MSYDLSVIITHSKVLLMLDLNELFHLEHTLAGILIREGPASRPHLTLLQMGNFA